MRFLDQAADYVAGVERRSDAFHAGVIGLLDDTEHLIGSTLHAIRSHVEGRQRDTHAKLTTATRILERLRPNKVRLP